MKRILTAAALAAALLSSAPRAAAACPYKVGPLGRYIAPAIVQGMTATDDGNAVEVWCTDALDGDDWFFTVDNETDLRIFDRSTNHYHPALQSRIPRGNDARHTTYEHFFSAD